jgi:hypothetical protein
MKTRLLFFSFLAFVSCNQKDYFGELEPNTSRIVAEFTNAGTGTFVSHDFTTNAIELDLTELRLATRSITKDETLVTVIVNPAVVTTYNAANGSAYTPVPAAALTLTSAEYRLNHSRRSVMVRAALRPAALLTESYAIGLSIASVQKGEISAAGKNVIVFISIKNDFDGIYSIKGHSEIPGTSFTGPFSVPCSEGLIGATSGVNSIFLSPSQPVFSAGGFTYISNLLPDIQIDKATNKITGVIARTGGIEVLFPYDVAYDSRYDPLTKTIYVKYGIAPAGSGRFVIDTLTYCGPR